MSRPSTIGAQDEERAVGVGLAVVADLVAERRQRHAVLVQPVEELLVGSVPGQCRGDRRADDRQHERRTRKIAATIVAGSASEPAQEAARGS